MLQNSLEPLFLIYVHPGVDIDVPYIQRQAKDKPVRIEANHGAESGSWRPPVYCTLTSKYPINCALTFNCSTMERSDILRETYSGRTTVELRTTAFYQPL